MSDRVNKTKATLTVACVASELIEIRRILEYEVNMKTLRIL